MSNSKFKIKHSKFYLLILFFIVSITIGFSIGYLIFKNPKQSQPSIYNFSVESNISKFLLKHKKLSPDKVTFINKKIYEADEYFIIFEGKIRNITKSGIHNVIIFFAILNYSDSDFYSMNMWWEDIKYHPSFYYQYFNYLPSNQDIDFKIPVSLIGHFGVDNAGPYTAIVHNDIYIDIIQASDLSDFPMIY